MQIRSCVTANHFQNARRVNFLNLLVLLEIASQLADERIALTKVVKKPLLHIGRHGCTFHLNTKHFRIQLH